MTTEAKAPENKEAAKPTRAPVGRVVIPDDLDLYSLFTDRRKETTRKADAANPEFLHSWKRADVPAQELAREKMEVVHADEFYTKPGKGQPALSHDPVKVRNDILVRRPRQEVINDKLRGELRSENKVKQEMDAADDTPMGRGDKPLLFKPSRITRKRKRAEDIGQPVN